MRVAVYYSNDDIRIEDRPVPDINPNEMLVKVKASGICGSDCMEWYRRHKAPLVLGHEIAGDVAETGANVKVYGTGDRVFVSHHIACDDCLYCEGGHHTACETLHTTNYDPGGFAEFIRVPEANVKKGVFKLPDGMTYDEGTFIEPVGCVARAQRLAGTRNCGSLLVLGCGISGLLHIKLARARGVKRIFATDISEYRLEAARVFGATETVSAAVFDPEWLREMNHGNLCGQVIVCTGAKSAFNQSLSSVDRGGKIVFFAPVNDNEPVAVPVTEYWRNEITLMTSYGAAHEDLTEAIDVIVSKEISIGDMITHRIPLERIGEGFKMVSDADESIKVIVEMS